jgi:2-amino-4-hydroxy-6-hydroxymethyldihydropteridine diphosphokinase
MQTCATSEGLHRVHHVFVIGLGSNLGERERYLTRAVEGIARIGMDWWSAPSTSATVQLSAAYDARTAAVCVEAVSRVFESEALGPPQPDFLNAAVRLSCAYEPESLLDALHVIEARSGRTRDVHWGPRTLDLDILWSDAPHVSQRLVVPHAQLRARSFALAPLLDVAPQLAAEYADVLSELGGAPVVRGALHFEPETGACAFAAVSANTAC